MGPGSDVEEGIRLSEAGVRAERGTLPPAKVRGVGEVFFWVAWLFQTEGGHACFQSLLR